MRSAVAELVVHVGEQGRAGGSGGHGRVLVVLTYLNGASWYPMSAAVRLVRCGAGPETQGCVCSYVGRRFTSDDDTGFT
jgi:hypothetical protein